MNDQIRVLIVDDNPQFLEIIKPIFESKNCLVEYTPDKQQALSLLIKKIFHIVFIDCVLQSGQGTELIHSIKDMLGDSIEIVMISGVVPGDTLSRYIEGGDCEFLSKPISHKQLEKKIKAIKEKIIYGKKQNILTKLFSPPSNSIQRLKFLVSLNKLKDYEFFLYISSALSSKESLSLTFTFDTRKHKIAINKGSIVDYESEHPEHFLNKLLSLNLITLSEKAQHLHTTQKDCINSLLNQCLLSSAQIIETKCDMLVEALKKISPGMDVSFTTHLISADKNSSPLIDQNEYASVLYPFFKKNFKNHHFPVFDEDVMKQKLVFQGDTTENNIPQDIQDLIRDLQSGATLTSFYNKHADNSTFYIFLLYVFLRGNVYFSASHLNTNHHLYERFRNLDRFIQKTPSKKLFSIIAGTPVFDPTKIKSIYLSFLQYNHPDKLSLNMPEDFMNLITGINKKMQYLGQRFTDKHIINQEEQVKKQESLEQEILVAEKKKICERYLTNKQYKEAFALINTLSSKVISENVHYQFFYLWLHFECKSIKMEIQKVHEYMKHIQAISQDLRKETLYHYCLGLYHESKHRYDQAKLCFENTKLIDPSFQPCYPAINRCTLRLLKEEQAQKTMFSKVVSFIKQKIDKKGA